VRVALAEDGMLFREGLVRLLTDRGFTVSAACATADELVRAVERDPPDVAIVDMRMPPTHTDEGLRAAQAIRARRPGFGVLVLTQYAEPGLAGELLADSVDGLGYLLKDRVQDMNDFAGAVRRVAEGGSAIDPEIVSGLLRRDRARDPVAQLTPREREVLGLMAEGRSNLGIAERLGVTERAVQKHITSIFQRLELPAGEDDHRRVLAVLRFLRAHPVG
jgi:DNA-binding NarL/FixJ family response regulator